MTHRLKKKMKFERWVALFSLLIFLLIWEILSDFKLISTLFFPAPSTILVTFWEMLVGGKLSQTWLFLWAGLL